MDDQTLKPAEITSQPNELGVSGKLINIFVNPLKTFESINRKPTWLVPMILIMLLTAISLQITFPMIMNAQMENLRNNPNIPPEQLRVIEQQLADNIGKQRIAMTAAPLIFIPLIFYLLLAGIFYFVGSVILGGDCSFKKVLSVWSWSTCIGIVASIVTVPLFIAKGNLNVTLSPALLLSGDAIDSTLYIVLSQLNFFTAWQLAVFAFGFATIYRFSVSKGYITIGVLWGIWIALATIFSSTLKKFGMM